MAESDRIGHLVRASLHDAPVPCRACTWWQWGARPSADKERWAAGVEGRFGAWGMLYREGERTVGAVQYGPADAFGYARRLPAGPPSADAVLLTCAWIEPDAGPYVLQSLLLAMIGEARDRGLIAVEAFAAASVPPEARHHMPLSRIALEEVGFVAIREAGDVALMRLDLRRVVGVAALGESILERARRAIAERRREAERRGVPAS
jgi:hypothetical protein